MKRPGPDQLGPGRSVRRQSVVDASLLTHPCIDKRNGKTSFLARPAGTLQMISEAACCLPGNSHSRANCAPCDSRRSACLHPPLAVAGFGPSRRTCRRCGFHMKGLRPLHTSPEFINDFVDNLSGLSPINWGQAAFLMAAPVAAGGSAAPHACRDDRAPTRLLRRPCQTAGAYGQIEAKPFANRFVY